jgi:hypothetical protein
MAPQKSPKASGSYKPGAEVLSVRMPVGYIRVLESEAASLGLRRGAFLVLLLRRKRSEVQLERAKNAQEYRVTEDELTARKLWLWYLPPGVRAPLEEDCLHMGLNSIGNWVTQTLNQWLGRPNGLTVTSRKAR